MIKSRKRNQPYFHPNFLWIVLSVSLGIGPLYAQDAAQNRYVVFFTDKDASAYSLDRPEEYLSPKALERRAEQNIAVDTTDLPVNARYVDQLAEAGADVYYTSRWLNAAMVASTEDASTLGELDFVTHVELIKPTRQGGRHKPGSSKPGSSKPGSSKPGSSYEGELAPVQSERNEEQLLNMLQNEMLGINEMHQAGYTGRGVSIAVFDGGFKGVDTVSFFRHLYENGRMMPGYDFVGNSPNVYRYGQHGTEALSCIAAYQPGVLEAGAYEANIMLCITEESTSEYRVEEYNWLFAAERADSAGVDIISTSLGYTTFDDADMNYEYADLDGNTAIITRAVNLATDKGMLCVISAGNEGSSRWRYISPPADAENVLAVGAVSSTGDRVSFSSFGPTADGRVKPDVSALGLQTVVVNAAGSVTRSNGTSFSAPLITGLTAGVWEAFPDATNIEIINRVRAAGSLAMTPNNELGYGVPSFGATLDPVLSTTDEQTEARYRVYPNPIENGKLFIESDLFDPVEVNVYNSTGQLMMKEYFASSATDPTATLDTSELGPGVYVLHILSALACDTVKVIKF